MGNIWGMLLQGITVSFTAILLLVIKRVMADKENPINNKLNAYGTAVIKALPFNNLAYSFSGKVFLILEIFSAKAGNSERFGIVTIPKFVQ